MSLRQKENVIKEKRTNEAIKKNMMGINGKLGLIAQALGSPIVRQASGLFDASFLDDPYQEYAESQRAPMMSDQKGPEIWKNEIQEMQDGYAEELGYVFDGLSRGMHIEVKFWHNNQKLEASYGGYEVYKEVAGELYAYNPQEEWEQMVDRLHKTAKEQFKIIKERQELEMVDTIDYQRKSLLQRLRSRWGF